MPGSPRKADGGSGRSKKGAKATVTLLTTPDPEEFEIPPMPPAKDFIGIPHLQTNKRGWNDSATLKQSGLNPNDEPFPDEEMEPEWNPAVVRWWNDIWSSPMASEFVKSDIHGLYMGCVFLNESLNPFYKLGDRTAAFGKFEGVQKAYGLTPSARESLRWSIAQGTAAQKRTEQIRGSLSAGQKHDRRDVSDMYKRHA